jgi:hypothetical protein
MAFPTTWIAPSADGRLELFVVGTHAPAGVELWHLYQIAPAGGWSQWVSHGSAPGVFNNWNDPVVARDSDGRLELFMGFGSETWQIWQTSRNGGWTPQWAAHPAPAGSLATGDLALTLRPDNCLELFVIGVISAQQSELWHIRQTAPSQGWTDWSSLGSPAAAGGLHTPVVAASADGRLEVFATGSDGALWHIWQTSPNGGWSSWLSHGGPPGTTLNDLWHPVVAPNSQRRLELFAVGDDNALWHIWQIAPNGGWSSWTSHGTPPGTDFFNSGGPAMAASADGRLELFICGKDEQLWHIWQVAPSGGWSSWTSHGHPPIVNPPFPVGVWNTPGLALNSAGRLELFVAGTNTELWHIWQTAPNQGWSGWLSHGAPAGFNIFGPS